jgi:hypothetical protein
MERKLADFYKLYNSHRVHSALDDTTPARYPRKAKSASLTSANYSGNHIAAVYTSCPSPLK